MLRSLVWKTYTHASSKQTNKKKGHTLARDAKVASVTDNPVLDIKLQSNIILLVDDNAARIRCIATEKNEPCPLLAVPLALSWSWAQRYPSTPVPHSPPRPA
jgi:uncharacterized protein YcsI (UPF0317 family)